MTEEVASDYWIDQRSRRGCKRMRTSAAGVAEHEDVDTVSQTVGSFREASAEQSSDSAMVMRDPPTNSNVPR